MNAVLQSYWKESGKAVLQACVPFKELSSKAKFTYRIRPEEDPYGEGNNDYQRRLSTSHVKEIISYLRASILNIDSNPTAIFPTSMLIAFTDEDLSVDKSQSIIDVNIPDGCYIVDGQHRLKAMNDLYKSTENSLFEEDHKIKDFLDNYQFNCTLLINFDVWEQARIFADVNFKQKKVNKSLYYEIYGQEYSDNPSNFKQNGIFLAHSLVEYLNTNAKSPLYHQIRMLGTGDGVISQSFLVEALVRHITSPRGIWYFDPYSVKVNKELLQPMKVELITFLQVIKEELSDYWLGKKSILYKTTGIGASMRLMGHIHNLIPNVSRIIQMYDSNNYSEDYAKALQPFIKRIVPDAKELFSSIKDVGLYANTGGKGMEMALYKKLVELVDKKQSFD